MKLIKNIKSLMIVGLMLQAGIGLVHSKLSAGTGQDILNRIEREKSSVSDWKPTGPTAEDIRSVTKVEKLAVKGSQEEKLINAVKNGDLKNVKTFIAAGVGLEARDSEDMTALMRAAEKGYSDIVRTLIDAGANINAADKYGFTAFLEAADKKHVDVVKMLVAKGVPTDDIFEGIFMRYALEGNIEMVKVLIESTRIPDNILCSARGVCRDGSEISNVIAQALNKESQ